MDWLESPLFFALERKHRQYVDTSTIADLQKIWQTRMLSLINFKD